MIHGKMSREEQHFVGRIINRLRAKPVYATLKDCAEVWGLTTTRISELSQCARVPILETRYGTTRR